MYLYIICNGWEKKKKDIDFSVKKNEMIFFKLFNFKINIYILL